MTQTVRQYDLKQVLTKATEALARLDAGRLEEMALSCAMLVRGADSGRHEMADRFDLESEDTMREMAIFMRVLDATKANLQVMRRLREMRATQLEYRPSPIDGHTFAEDEHGYH